MSSILTICNMGSYNTTLDLYQSKYLDEKTRIFLCKTKYLKTKFVVGNSKPGIPLRKMLNYKMALYKN